MTSEHSSNNIYELLTAYADGEVSGNDAATIEQQLQRDERMRRALALEKRTKELVRSACARSTTPVNLYERCLMAVESEAASAKATESATASTTPDQTTITPIAALYRIPSIMRWAAAAVVLIASLVWLNLPPSTTPLLAEFVVEDHVYRHFTSEHTSQLITSSTREAELYIRQNYGIDITVPELKGSRFDGIQYTEFVPGREAPMLMYSVAGQDDPVMIFAFKVDHMDSDIRLVRDEDAVATCTHHDAVHIKDIAGKHVVSWMWDDTWYAGISHHDGNVLASMLPINR